jgi:hypothetical protein
MIRMRCGGGSSSVFKQRIGRLVVGAVHVVDQENAAAAMMRQERRALFDEARLLDGDLAQRAIGREGDEIGMGGKQQRIVVALVGGHFSRSATISRLCFEAEIVLLDLFGMARQQARAQPAGERGFADALRSGEEQRLRQPVLRDHLLERLR